MNSDDFMSCEDCACLRPMQPCEACPNFDAIERNRLQNLSSFAMLHTFKERLLLKDTVKGSGL